MSGDAAKTVFVSYRTTDDVAAREINELVPALERRFGAGAVFYDKKSMTPGQWAQQVLTTLPKVPIVIVLVADQEAWLRGITPQTKPVGEGDEVNDWVQWEVETSLRNAAGDSRKIVVPLFLKNPSGLFEKLPESMKALQVWQSKQLLTAPNLQRDREEFVLWLSATAVGRTEQRRALLERIQAPLRLQSAVELMAAEKHRIRAYFSASLGILTKDDRELFRDLQPDRPLRSDTMLALLDGFHTSLPLFRFLGLMLFHEIDGKRIALPEETRVAWDSAVNGLNEWDLTPGDDANVAEWRQIRDCLRPVFQLAFHDGYGDTGKGLQIEGTVRWGQVPQPLELSRNWIDWHPDRPDLGEQRLLEALQPVFEELLAEAEHWLGSRKNWHCLPMCWPQMELFLARSQQIWPLELTPVGDKTVVGAIFRVVRRLFDRHFPATGGSVHASACSAFHDPVGSDKIHRADRWEEVGHRRPNHAAFRCLEPLRRPEVCNLETWACGVWSLQESPSEPGQIDELLMNDIPCAEYGRQLHEGEGNPPLPVAVYLDRTPAKAPLPHLQKVAVEAERRAGGDPDADLEAEL